MGMMFARKSRILLASLATMLGGSASGGSTGLTAGLQDDEYYQKNTALLSWYPEEGEIVTRAAALAAQGRYVEALAIYDDALEKRPNTVVAVDKARAYGLREYVMRQISAWPEEGKAAYRRRADPLADHHF